MSTKLLVVDDDGDLRLAINQYFTLIGFECTEAESAEEALEQLQHESFDAVTLDMYMEPGIGGAGFLEQYQEYSTALAVIVLTGYPSAPVPASALPEITSGNITYLQKPIDMAVLREAILSAINPHWAGFKVLRDSNTVLFNNEPVKISRTQYILLNTLIPSAGQFTSYATLGTAVYGEDMTGEEALRKLRSHVSRLRTFLTLHLGAEGLEDYILQFEIGSGIKLPRESDLVEILDNA